MSKSIKGYSPDIISSMVEYYNSLSESQKRQYAYIEAKKLGWGGIGYISGLFNISYKTIRKGGREIQNNVLASGTGRQRKVGGGRKRKKTVVEQLTE